MLTESDHELLEDRVVELEVFSKTILCRKCTIIKYLADLGVVLLLLCESSNTFAGT